MAKNTTSNLTVKMTTTSHRAIELAHFVQDVIAEPAPTFEREIVMGILMALYVSTQIAKATLPHMFPRINRITLGRQRQIFTLWPMIILKLAVCYFTAEAEYASRFRPHGLDTKPFELIHHQTNIFYILVLGYVFELLHRPNPIELDYHHVFVLMGYTYYRVRFAHIPNSETATSASTIAVVNLFHLVAIMVIYGVGPVDLASEAMRFFYYAIEPSVWSVQVMRLCVAVSWIGRLSQWVVMLQHLSKSMTSLLNVWGWWEMGICTVFIAYWIWMETVELFFLVSLSKRYANTVVEMRKAH